MVFNSSHATKSFFSLTGIIKAFHVKEYSLPGTMIAIPGITPVREKWLIILFLPLWS